MADYTRLVAEERTKYGPYDEARRKWTGAPIGNEAAWNICNGAAKKIRAETGDTGWGLHRKGGNNFNGYAIDIIAHRDGRMFDVLGDAEGEGRPGWTQVDGSLDWAPPVGAAEPGPVDPGPGPGPVDPGPVAPGALAAVLAKLDQIAANQVQTAVAVQAGLAEIKKAVTDGVKIVLR